MSRNELLRASLCIANTKIYCIQHQRGAESCPGYLISECSWSTKPALRDLISSPEWFRPLATPDRRDGHSTITSIRSSHQRTSRGMSLLCFVTSPALLWQPRNLNSALKAPGVPLLYLFKMKIFLLVTLVVLGTSHSEKYGTD